MKKQLLTYLLSLFSIGSINSQTWSAPGATWLFSVSSPSPKVEGYQQMSFIDTVTAGGKLCSRIGGPSAIYYYSGSYPFPLPGFPELKTHFNNGVLTSYVYDQYLSNRFDTLANFNATIGQGWYCPHFDSANCWVNAAKIRPKSIVTDTGHVNINGFNLKRLKIYESTTGTYTAGVYSYEIVERMIIPSGYFYPYHCCVIDCGPGPALTCYIDNALGVYKSSFGSGNCNFASIVESPSDWFLIMFPNPATDLITVFFPGTGTLKITDQLGREVLVKNNVQSLKEDIYIGNLEKGIYQMTFTGASGAKFGRLLKE
jgi:hypothetical protein